MTVNAATARVGVLDLYLQVEAPKCAKCNGELSLPIQTSSILVLKPGLCNVL